MSNECQSFLPLKHNVLVSALKADRSLIYWIRFWAIPGASEEIFKQAALSTENIIVFNEQTAPHCRESRIWIIRCLNIELRREWRTAQTYLMLIFNTKTFRFKISGAVRLLVQSLSKSIKTDYIYLQTSEICNNKKNLLHRNSHRSSVFNLSHLHVTSSSSLFSLFLYFASSLLLISASL